MGGVTYLVLESDGDNDVRIQKNDEGHVIMYIDEDGTGKTIARVGLTQYEAKLLSKLLSVVAEEVK